MMQYCELQSADCTAESWGGRLSSILMTVPGKVQTAVEDHGVEDGQEDLAAYRI
jgi:hypothetical protein